MPDLAGSAAAFGPPPILDLLETGGPGPLAVQGDNWVLDLGEVEAGSLFRTLRLVVSNLATPPADALTVRFEAVADPDIRLYAPDAYTNIGPRSGRGELDAILTATTPGLHEASLVLHPVQVAADGSVQPLADRVLTIRETVVGNLAATPIPDGAFSTSLPASSLLTAPVRLDGQDFARIQNLVGWQGSGSLDIAPDQAAADQYGNAYLLATFEAVHADFSAAGPGRTVDVVGVESGTLALAPGDTALWSFISGGAAGGATITTQGGAAVRVTALGADTLDDRLGETSLFPYNIYPFSYPRGNSYYDGHLSTATVQLGGQGNTVTAEALVNLTVTGGEGGNHVIGGGGVNLFALTGPQDWLEGGSGQTTFIQQAGSLQGDRISGFDTGDQIRFQGFAADAALLELGGGRFRVVDGAGHGEDFTVDGMDHLVAGTDYLFV